MVDDAVFGCALFSADHDDFFNVARGEVFQYLCLRHVSLHLSCQTDNPAVQTTAIFLEGVYASCKPDRFHCTALGFATSVATENPTIALG